jgi:hypothetical protein
VAHRVGLRFATQVLKHAEAHRRRLARLPPPLPGRKFEPPSRRATAAVWLKGSQATLTSSA